MNSNFAINYMWAAYAAVWIIHGGYLLWLHTQARHLRAEMAEVNPQSNPQASGRG